ncbi:MAG: hypothetical protein E7274_01280 [Pseudobutyrivibrio ruminis]|uniref:hypothetical protein n=1 Tax=Pseudobutyrivibrio ruminis TaxID=46206 RepID=UPI0026E999AD|nr:hypothetical protein [Pseudobutyrivibrio ruminis]MBE5912677.1 hypothetical protein [Pseudobutyrivibrio ruminis]
MKNKQVNSEIYHDKKLLDTLTLMTINDECDLLINFATFYRDPNISLTMLPYYALFCVEAGKRFEEIGIPLEQIDNGPFNINVTRARLKLFNDRIGKVIKLIDTIHNDQDQLYKNKYKSILRKKFNLYANMGITFYKNKIMANTYYIISLMDKKDGHYVDVSGPEVFEFAKGLGQTIDNIFNISIQMKRNAPDIRRKDITVLYKDININRCKVFSIEGKDCRALSVLLLNVLGNINFTNYLVEDIIGNNTWKLRIQYISMYYAREMMLRVAEKTEDIIISKRIEEGINSLYPIFDSKFRNCLMHYSFAENGQKLIEEKYFDIETPLYGLVESCFDGKSYKELSNEIKGNLFKMESTLNSMLLIDSSKLKKF